MNSEFFNKLRILIHKKIPLLAERKDTYKKATTSFLKLTIRKILPYLVW
jgi:hypothetical protein